MDQGTHRYGLYRLWMARVDRRVRTITEGDLGVDDITASWPMLWSQGLPSHHAAEIALEDWGYRLEEGVEP